MPTMDGPTTVRAARKMQPDLPILFMSGYAEEQLRKSIDIPNVSFPAKPFSVQQLAETARERRPRRNKGFSFAEQALGRRAMPGTATILIVEDEPLIAMMLEDFLETLGHTVARQLRHCRGRADHIEKGGFDVAILDVHLKGESVWPVAERSRERQIPFVLATGGHVEPPPAQFADVPVIEKPYTVDRVTPALDAAFAG